MNPSLPSQLAERLARRLPGWSAQVHYQPELSFGRHRGPADADARAAAVLILLYPRDNQWHVPLILRPAHMLDHGGQVSFPGGAIEPGESGREAALREYSEELGVGADNVKMLGRLSKLYLFASNFRIEPWVAALDDRPRFAPSQGEVERVLEMPLAHLLDPASRSAFARRQGEIVFRAPCFCFDSERIWGATSMMLAELFAVLQDLSV